MRRFLRASRWPGLGAGIIFFAAILALPLSAERPASAQPPAKDELPASLHFVPTDAALFVYVDAARIWKSTLLKDIRKADAKTFEFVTGMVKSEFGLTPDDLKSVVVFVPRSKEFGDQGRLGVVLNFNKALDKAKFRAGAEKFLKDFPPKVAFPDDRTALVLLNLKEEDVKPSVNWKSGPLAEALKAAASGKHALVAGVTLANLPEELRGDDLPAPIRPFQPLLKAVTITATVDLETNPALNVRVKTGTAGQAIECEKSLGLLLSLIQEQLNEGVKEFEAAKEPGLKDLIAVFKAVGAAAKGAKFSTLGNETHLTVTLPGDLPFAGAFLAARKKVTEASATTQSVHNLKQIALATINFADSSNGNLPPAAICDKTGKPLLSWRVAILPYIEEEKLFKEFKLDEPWDSEHNKKLLARMPKVYAMPGKTQPGDTDTYYRVFVGNGAGYDWVKGTRYLADFPDGTSNTLQCITAADAVPWTKPDELAYDPEKDMTKFFGLVVNGKCQVAMFDGSVRTLKKIPSKATLHALITRGGGEVIGDDFR